MTAVDGEPALIDSVLAQLREHVDAPDAAQFESFVRQYYRWVPTEDLLGRDASDLYGAAMGHWRLAGERRHGATAIRVYDPQLERDGWESPHTVIEIVSDDMPFLVDSLTMELNRAALGIHLTIHPVLLVRRDDAGKLLEVLPAGAESADATRESVLHVEVDRRGGEDERHALEAGIARVLAEVRAAVEDWKPMGERLRAVIETLATSGSDAVDLAESEEYLRWLESNHFTFLGYQEYAVRDGALRPAAGTALGVLRVDAAAATSDCDDAWARAIADLPR
ncbi:MAG: NAD-glutamate dehydrogenase, partial [Solirubrobacteraceae bacterium]